MNALVQARDDGGRPKMKGKGRPEIFWKENWHDKQGMKSEGKGEIPVTDLWLE